MSRYVCFQVIYDFLTPSDCFKDRFVRNSEDALDVENRAYYLTIAIQRYPLLRRSETKFLSLSDGLEFV